MLDTIGESAVRTTTRADNNLAVENRYQLQEIENGIEYARRYYNAVVRDLQGGEERLLVGLTKRSR